ncbi:MAG TPA: HYR domain-containing protein, partial [Blastocatellia bacterium]
NLDGRPDLAVGSFGLGNVTILLNSRPVAKVKNVSVAAGPTCTANASIDDGSFDPDGHAITLTQSPPGPYPKGTTMVTLSVIDSTGASACAMATVTVYDAQAPAFINCPASGSTITDPNTCSKVLNYVKPVAIDNCGGVTVSCDPAPGATFPKGTTTVVCTATDTSNNQTTCSFPVTVRDTQQPSMSCPSNLIKSTDPDQCSAVVNYPAPTVSDNCPGATSACNPASGSTFPKGVTTINCTATDSSGNSTACSFTITVNDNQPPAIACPASITLTAARPGDASIVVNYAPPGFSDNCAGATVVCSPASGTTFPLGVTTVTCTATDAAGNTTSCGFTVSVFDVCLQDDSAADTVLLFNSSTGDYRFCYAGGTLTGRGTATRRGNTFTLVDSRSDRRVQATMDASMRRGSASLQSPPGQTRCTISDRDTSNNKCSCGAGG